ncbi:hypothetical protein ACYB2S_14605 [Corynebacterium variabile]|uniref:hypothetical protein n=1 Tax=Corynebacterium variabile TaxID=1727 RepID=UPI003CA09E50
MQRWLEPELGRLDNADFGTQVRDAVGLPVTDPLMWVNRVIALPHGEWALAGIRFRDRNLERCFVDIIATSLPARPESLATLAPALEFFSEFSPKRLRIVVPDLDLFTASGDPAAPDTEPDLRVVAAALDEATPLSTGYVSLVSTSPDAASSLAEQIYGRIAADNPVLLECSHPSTASCLSDPADEGLLFTIRFRDEDAGVLALRRQDACGLAGWLVEEKCVDPAFGGTTSPRRRPSSSCGSWRLIRTAPRSGTPTPGRSSGAASTRTAGPRCTVPSPQDAATSAGISGSHRRATPGSGCRCHRPGNSGLPARV